MDPMAATLWLLIVQGSGGYGPATVTKMGKYNTEATCKADGERIKRAMVANYLCLEICTGNRGVCR